jgi:asparagine synthase (glutamine-hydrolysing)
VPILGIQRLLPGHIASWHQNRWQSDSYFTLHERVDPRFADRQKAVRLIRKRCTDAVVKRLCGESEVGLFLSGGIDSAGVAHWLTQAGVRVRAFTLDFGTPYSEQLNALEVARALDISLVQVPANAELILPILPDLVWKLDLPFGDPVTGPQYLLGQAARAAGLQAIFNGEGGDQLFGGWTNKPMISAELYAHLYDQESREEAYLRSYHRFYGLEHQLYRPEFQQRMGGPGQRRALLRPYLSGQRATTFLNRLRLADISLKGAQNILPRMERMANGWGLDARTPLFDRTLANASFKLPPQMKLRGACEKYVLKLALQRHLPRQVVWGKKFGMSVPVTDWLLSPLWVGAVEQILGPTSLDRRGLFRSEYVARLRRGENEPYEARRRRVGERLWTLLMLELWMRVFVDGRGRRPASLW